MTTPKSYTSTRTSPVDRARELWNLYLYHRRDAGRRVDAVMTKARTADEQIGAHLGEPLRAKRLLDIGPGQQLPYLTYFGAANTAIGVDLDLIVEHFSVRGYAQMLRRNGPVRVAKTLGRHTLGLHRRYRAELTKRVGISEPRYALVQADASRLGFRSGGFDVVFSNSVFEHLDAPELVMREAARVLRPGGVAYISVALWTSEGGAHDPRIFAGRRDALPYWAHLRPAHEHLVRSNAYLNRRTLADWRASFAQEWPGVEVHAHCDDAKRAILDSVRAEGELGGFTDEELLADDVVAIWRKPAS